MDDDDDRSRWKEMVISRSCRQKAKNEDLRLCKKFIEIHGKSDELQVTRSLTTRSRAILSGAKAFIHASLQCHIVPPKGNPFLGCFSTISPQNSIMAV